LRAEGYVDEIANARMTKRQLMRWSPRGAHRVALVRAAVLARPRASASQPDRPKFCQLPAPPVEHRRFAVAAINVNINRRFRRRRWHGLRHCVHDNLSVGRSTRIIVRIYTGHNGQTHSEDLPLATEKNYNVALQAGASLVFRCFPADYWSDWHTAPRQQYIFILVRQMEIGIGDGTTRRFGPGDVVLADDLTGQGHTTRSLGVPRISATVPVGA
jgi:hypothetical protein